MRTLEKSKAPEIKGYERISIDLPEKTVEMIDFAAPGGDRGRFVARVLKRYISSENKKNLRKMLKEGYLRNAKRDLAITKEWFHLEEEAWQKSGCA